MATCVCSSNLCRVKCRDTILDQPCAVRLAGYVKGGMSKLILNEHFLHPWNVTYTEAAAIQEELRRHVVTENHLGSVITLAGVDVAFPEPQTARAAVVVLRFPELLPLDYAVAEAEVEFPYMPGLLAFREVPAVLAAVAKLQVVPDLFIFDAHGLAHPRRFGLACHAGLLLDRPSIGCAKNRLVGDYVEPGPERGAKSPLVDGSEQIGAVVRTRMGVKPLFVSIGHMVDLDTAVRYVLDCAPKYRLPETTRCAHLVAGGEKIGSVHISENDLGIRQGMQGDGKHGPLEALLNP
jgi:deoxyribonuclease V